jgi:hypothetical protein
MVPKVFLSLFVVKVPVDAVNACPYPRLVPLHVPLKNLGAAAAGGGALAFKTDFRFCQMTESRLPKVIMSM